MSSTFPVRQLIISFHHVRVLWHIMTNRFSNYFVCMYTCLYVFVYMHSIYFSALRRHFEVCKQRWRFQVSMTTRIAFNLYFEVLAARTLVYYLKQRNIFNLQRILQWKMHYARIHLQTHSYPTRKIFFVSIVSDAAAAVFAEQRK